MDDKQLILNGKVAVIRMALARLFLEAEALAPKYVLDGISSSPEGRKPWTVPLHAIETAENKVQELEDWLASAETSGDQA